MIAFRTWLLAREISSHFIVTDSTHFFPSFSLCLSLSLYPRHIFISRSFEVSSSFDDWRLFWDMDDIGSCFLTFFGSFVFASDTVTISHTAVIRIVYVCYVIVIDRFIEKKKKKKTIIIKNKKNQSNRS